MSLGAAFPARAQSKKMVRIGYLSLARIEADGSWIGMLTKS